MTGGISTSVLNQEKVGASRPTVASCRVEKEVVIGRSVEMERMDAMLWDRPVDDEIRHSTWGRRGLSLLQDPTMREAPATTDHLSWTR